MRDWGIFDRQETDSGGCRLDLVAPGIHSTCYHLALGRVGDFGGGWAGSHSSLGILGRSVVEEVAVLLASLAVGQVGSWD